MARLFTSGFEIPDLTADVVAPDLRAIPEWSDTNGAGVAITTDSARTGVYGLKVSGLSSGTRTSVFFRTHVTAAAGVRLLRFYLRIVTLPDIQNRIAFITGTSIGGTQAVWCAINTDGTLQLGDEDGSIAATSTALSLNTWYRINLEISTIDAAGSHDVNLQINGTIEASATNRSIAATMGGFQLGGNLNGEANTTGEWHFDDVGINDVNGTNDNASGTPGDGSVVHIPVATAGAGHAPGTQGTDFETRTGTVLSTDGSGGVSVESIDELEPDWDTTWIELLVNSTGATNRVHYYQVAAPTSHGIGASDTILFVNGLYFCRGETSSGVICNPLQRIADGATAAGTSKTTGSTSWTMGNGAVPKWGMHVAYVDPNAVAWTPSTLAELELGFRATSITPTLQVTWVTAQVEFVPAVGGGPTGRVRHSSMTTLGVC